MEALHFSNSIARTLSNVLLLVDVARSARFPFHARVPGADHAGYESASASVKFKSHPKPPPSADLVNKCPVNLPCSTRIPKRKEEQFVSRLPPVLNFVATVPSRRLRITIRMALTGRCASGMEVFQAWKSVSSAKSDAVNWLSVVFDIFSPQPATRADMITVRPSIGIKFFIT